MIFHAPQLAALLSILLSFSRLELSAALGAPPPVPPPVEALPIPPAVNAHPSTDGLFLFEQLLHHEDPSLGTFAQRVWWNSEFWGGPGSPVCALFAFVLFSFQMMITMIDRRSDGGRKGLADGNAGRLCSLRLERQTPSIMGDI